MLEGFSFVHEGRTFACHAEVLMAGETELWWWFTVTQGGNRYAPFRAASRDTRASVQARIVAYYENHLAHRAMPQNQHWARRPKAGAPGAAGASPADGAVAAGHRARIARENAERAAAEAKAK